MKKNNSTDLPASGEKTAAAPKKKHDWAIKLLCVFASFILWLYVMEVESPEYETTIGGITVELVGTDILENQNELSIYSGRGLPLTITVSGKRSVVTKVNPDEIVATADVSGITESGRHQLDIRVDLPGGVALIQKSQDNVTVYVDKSQSSVIPIKENVSKMDMPASYEIGTLDLEYSSINISGPENILSNVAAARVDIDLTDRTSSFTETCPVYLVDMYNNVITSPYLKYSPTEITVDIPIYKSVTVPVEVYFAHGYLNESNTQITVTPSEVTIKGDESVMNNTDTLLAPIILDEKKITGKSYGRTVTLQPAAGTFIAKNITEVQIDVEVDDSIQTMDMLVTNIEVTGAADIHYQIEEDDLLVTICGPMDKLSKLRPSDIYAEVDLSGYSTETSGTVTKTVAIMIDAEDAEGLYEVGEYTVQVKIN